MTDLTWGATIAALEAGLQKAQRDVTANAPLPPPATLSNAALAAGLAKLNAELPTIIAAVQAHPGVIAGLADLLEALKTIGAPWAAEIEEAFLDAPGVAALVESWLPTALMLFSATQPAPTYAAQNKPRGS